MESKIKYLILTRQVFLDRVQTQEEIHRLIEECFSDKKQITLEDYYKINEDISSEMFLSVFYSFVKI